ncbi:hypothetical protein [Sphingomonas oryzagri]
MKGRKQEWIERLALLLASAITGAVIVLAAAQMADVGDLLGFLGGGVGAFLAVAGAVYVEDRRRSAERKERLAFIREAVEDVRVSVEALTFGREATAENSGIDFKVAVLASVREKVQPDRVATIRAFMSFDEAWAALQSAYASASWIRSLGDNGDLAPTASMIDARTQMLSAIDAVLRALEV